MVPFLLICAMVALVVGAKGTFDRLVTSFRGLTKKTEDDDKKNDLRKKLGFAVDIGFQSAGCIVLIKSKAQLSQFRTGNAKNGHIHLGDLSYRHPSLP